MYFLMKLSIFESLNAKCQMMYSYSYRMISIDGRLHFLMALQLFL